VTVRDSQRQKVFDAENAVRPTSNEGHAEIDAWATRIVKSAWFNRRCGRWNNPLNGPLTAIVLDSYAATNCTPAVRIYGGKYVAHATVAREHRTRIDVAHVLAHLMVNEAYPAADIRGWHGPEFCKAFLEIVGHWDSEDTKKALTDEFRARKVKFRVYSPEAREKASLRGKARHIQADLLKLRDELGGS
jgi:hypothetical protein